MESGFAERPNRLALRRATPRRCPYTWHTGAGSFRLFFGRIGSLEHEAPLVELLLQYGLGDHLGFVLGN